MNEHELLNERLAESVPDDRRRDAGIPETANQSYPTPTEGKPAGSMDLCQWQVGANGVFRPAAKTVQSLGSGCYSVHADEYGPYLKEQKPLCDNIIELPDSSNSRVLASVQRFWNSASRYRTHGLLFKRGILLWGPPGSGKTVTVHLLTRDLIERGGIVIFCGNPNITMLLLSAIRTIERDRPLILVMEDVDEIISRFGEHEILSILDGENQTDNVVSIATTNYPERLGARIVNRPSRFDERIFIGMPNEASRLTYLRSATANGTQLDSERLIAWARDTEGLSIAHLRELVAAVLCLDQEYSDVIARLRSMNERPKDIDGFAKRPIGITASANQQYAGRAQ